MTDELHSPNVTGAGVNGWAVLHFAGKEAFHLVSPFQVADVLGVRRREEHRDRQ